LVDWPRGVILLAGAFCLGAIPWGYLIAKATRGIDLRQVGSGGTGATNVLRTLGKGPSIAVFILDFLKGVAAVVIAQGLGFGPWWVAGAGVAAVAGHCWSPFIAFKGGKGMATGAGAAAALFPPVLAIVPITVAIVWLSRYVSLGSLTSAILAVVLAVVATATGHLALASAIAIALIALIIVGRHGGNIQRLLRGTERRIGETVPA
jgi:glycerol-3-phosphate acyltransferase PlsY